jgi:UrcA family protein
MPRPLHIALISGLMLASAAPFALAQDVESRVVRYGDLNLKDEHDAERLIDRIENAAEGVCDTNAPYLAVRRAERECAAETEQVAVDDVDHPTVTNRYYATRYGSGYIEGSYDNANPAPVVSPPK